MANSNENVNGYKKVINWFPGHMAKAKRNMEEQLKKVDSIVYVLDARAPFSCINPEFDNLISAKPTLYVINKCDMVQSEDAAKWKSKFAAMGMRTVVISGTAQKNGAKVLDALTEVNAEKLERNRAKGVNYSLKAMVIGMPNTGKSTIINCLCRGKRTVTGNKPGVTRTEQWVRLDNGMMLMDTPGTLCHSIKSETTAENLAFIGCIRDAVVDMDALALALIGRLAEAYPLQLTARYGVETSGTNAEILEKIALSRGFVLKGGEVDLSRAALAVIDDFRKVRIGKIILELPDER